MTGVSPRSLRGTEVAKIRGMNRMHLALAGTALGAGLFVHWRVRGALREHASSGRFAAGLHYVERGSGHPVVLLHGLGSMSDDFVLSGLYEEAARDYHAIAFDRPGYGHSPRPRARLWTPRAQARALHSAFQALGLHRPVIVGHSWGCLVALAYALEFPGDTGSLVLASGYYYPTLRPDAFLLVPPAIPLVGAVLRHTVSPLLGRLLWPAWLRLLFSPLSVPEYFSRFPMWMALRPGQLRAVGEESAMLAPVTAALSRRYSSLKVPAVVVAGDQDQYVSTEHHSQRLHQTLSGSAFIAVPGAGHMAHHAAPGVFMEAIRTARMLQG